MAKQEEEGKNRTVLIAVDGSEHSDRAFDCEYENCFVTRLKSGRTHMHNQLSTFTPKLSRYFVQEQLSSCL